MPTCNVKGCKKPIMRPHGYSLMCKEHYEKEQEENRKLFRPNWGIIDNTKYNGSQMNESHYKDLNTRVIDDDGNTLSGKAGLNYMESKGGVYAKRLKEYYR